MAQQEKKRKQFFQRLLNPYLVMIIDEETFEEQTQIRFSRLKMIFVGCEYLKLNSISNPSASNFLDTFAVLLF